MAASVLKETRVGFSVKKAIQGFAMQHYTDGGMNLGVTIWVPTGKPDSPYQAILCAVEITKEEKDRLIAGLKGEL